MKLKISFDKKAIGNFFLEHSEKVLLGAFLLVFATIIYGAAIRREKFDKNPEDLRVKSEAARRSLQGERLEMLKELFREQEAREDKGDYKKDADKIAEFNKQGISVKPYECDVALDKPLFGQRGKRGQPELFNVEDLRAAADFGAFQVNDSPGGGAAAPPPAARGGGRTMQPPATRAGGITVVRGKHWVVITGLVPTGMQANAYRKTFGEAVAYDPANDVPTYVDYFVERAEINSPADEKNPDFTKKFNSADVEKEATKDWSQPKSDVVENKYIDPNLTFPLGPLQNRAWGGNVAHETEIPVLNADGTSSGTPEGDNVGRGYTPNPRNVQGRQNRGLITSTDAVEYKLLRFFDFSVEPGKSYIYRVSLELKNPNFGLDENKLKKPELAQKNNLETPDLSQLDEIDTKSLENLDKSELGKLNITQLKKLDLTQLEKTDTTLLELSELLEKPDKLDKTQKEALDKLDKTQKEALQKAEEVLQKLDKTQKETLKKWLATVQSLKKQIAASQTERVDVPKDTQVLVGSAKPDDLGPGKFPVVLLTWAQKSGRAGYLSLTNVDRGQVLNLFNQTFVPGATDSPTNTSSDTEDKNADFITDATLLDMDGSKRFTMGKGPKSTAPREMLFMVVNGKSINLMLRDELEDMSEINRIKVKPETATTHDRSAEEKLLDKGSPPGRQTTRPK
jgi:archaellum component FlaC